MRDKPVDTIEYKGKHIDVYYDENTESPREWENMGTMLCSHRRYNLGDVKESKSMATDDILDYVNRKDVISLSLYLYDHSGLSMKCSRNGNPWYNAPLPQGHAEFDSGLVGFIVVTKEKILKEYSKKRMSKALVRKAFDLLQSEVEVYSSYLEGNCYGYEVREFGDSCWGFYGHDYEKNGLLESAQNSIDCGLESLQEEIYHEVGA